ncbi:hypothetical protein [Sphingomonas sp. UYP23]
MLFALIAVMAAPGPPAQIFNCAVVRVHDGDGPLWCSNGIKIRVAGIQAPAFEGTAPCREALRNTVARTSQLIAVVVVERLTLSRAMTCQPTGRITRVSLHAAR